MSIFHPLACGVLALLAAFPAAAQVYRCPGPPILYTDAISDKEAKAKDCRVIDSTITVLQTRKPNYSVPGSSSPRSPEGRVEASDQRSRDLESRRILEAELRREQERLSALQKEYNGGEPERRGDERNYVKYAERIASLKADIERKQSDVDAIRRELSKLPPL